MENVAKSVLQGFWDFQKCCKTHVARILKVLATFFFQMLQKKNLWVQLNGLHNFLEGYPQLHWHVYQNKTGTSTYNSW